MAIPFLNGIDVTGTVDLSNLTIDGAQGTDGQVLTSTGSGIAWEDASGGASLSGGAANKLAIWSGTDTLTNDINLHWNTTNDQLGIGNANPQAKLDITQTATAQGIKIRSSSVQPEITFIDSATGDSFAIGHNRSGSRMDIEINGTDTHTFKQNGNVGFGTTNPTRPLVVSETRTGSTASDAYTTVIKSVQSSGASPNPGTGGLKVQYTSSSSNVHAFGLVAGSSSSDFLTTGPMHFYTNSDLDTVSATGFAMTIDTSQRVGIGVTNPSQKLSVNGNVTADRYYGNGSTAFYIDPNDGTTSAILSGNVGINQTSPSHPLHITKGLAGTAEASSQLKLEYSSAYKLAISHRGYFFGPSNNDYRFYRDSDIQMVIKGFSGTSSYGYVGIGTDSPSEKLHVDDGFLKVQPPDISSITPPSITIRSLTNQYQSGMESSGHLTMKSAGSSSNFYWYQGSTNVMRYSNGLYVNQIRDINSDAYYLDPASSGVSLHINGIIDQDFEITDLNSAWTAPGTSRDQGFIFGRFQSNASNKPATNDNANWFANIYSHASGGTASYGIQLAGSNAGSGENALQLRNVSNGSFASWRKVYHEGHKPTYSELGTMAYSNLTGTPTIPTNNNQLTNGAGYITSFDITTQTDGKYLRSNADDTFTGKLSVGSTSNRRAGVYGIYDSYKTGHIWSIGTAYNIPNDGSNFGNLYGLAYKHTNNTTGGTMGGSHQMVWCDNGSPRGSIGYNSVWHAESMKAPIFYDSNNTAYYVNPNSSSFLRDVNVHGTFRFQRSATTQTGQDDNVSVTVGDSDITFRHNNDDDGDASVYNFQYRSGGNDVNILNFASNYANFTTPYVRCTNNSLDYAQLESNSSGGVFKAVSNGNTNILFRSYGESYTTNNFGIGTSTPVSNARLTVVGGGQTFGIPGNGANTGGRWLSFEGNTDGSGEGSGRLFFTEHNSSTTDMDDYGMSIGYRGGGTSITTAGGNTWTGLSAIGNGEWGMWGHNNSLAGSLIMYGDRAATFVNFAGNNITGVNRITTTEHVMSGSNVYAGGNAGFVFGSSTSEGEYIKRNGSNIEFVAYGEVKFDITAQGVHVRTGSTYRAQISNTGIGRFGNDVVAYYNFSDKRLKTNIKPTTNNLDKVLKLNPVEYNWKEGYRKDKKEIGLIAQEVEKIIPEVVRENQRLNDNTLYKQIDYEHLVSTLIGAVQEQQKQIDELKSIINGGS